MDVEVKILVNCNFEERVEDEVLGSSIVRVGVVKWCFVCFVRVFFFNRVSI